MTDAPEQTAPKSGQACAALLDAAFDLATQGKVHSVAIVMVTAPGIFRISAAGDDIDGLLAGAIKMQSELFAVIEKTKKPPAKPALTVIHNQ